MRHERANGVKILGTTLDRGDLSRLGGAVFVALVGAVVTGPDGSQTAPLSGVTGSLFHPRVIGWLVAGFLVWAVGTGTKIQKTRPAIKNPLAPVREMFHTTTARKGVKPSFYVVLIVLAVVIPRGFAPALQLSLFLDIGIYALLGLGLNIVVGFAGLLDLGYIAFYAIGAYATAYFTSNRSLPDHSPLLLNAFFVLPVAAVIAAIAGIILGGPTLRLRGDYLAIVTLGFGEIVQILARNSPKYTNGPRGVSFVPHLQIHALGIDYVFTNKALPYYYVLLTIIVLVMIGVVAGRFATLFRDFGVELSGPTILFLKVASAGPIPWLLFMTALLGADWYLLGEGQGTVKGEPRRPGPGRSLCSSLRSSCSWQ